MRWCIDGHKVNFARGKIPSGGKRSRKCIYSVAGHKTVKHCAKFGWLLLSDVAVVTRRRRETRSNLLRCPKLTKRSQPLVGRSSPYCEDMWRRYCCLTNFFSDGRHMPCQDIARQSCVMMRRWRFLATFCVLYFQRASCSTFQICILNSH